LLGEHDGIWNEGKSETEPEVAIKKVLKLLVAGQKGRGVRVKLGARQFDCFNLFINGKLLPGLKF
jgi:hypothetical protein